MSSPTTIKSVSAPLNCDSVETGPNGAIFVGMYNYDEASSVRGGGFLLLDNSGDITYTYTDTQFGCLDAIWLNESFVKMACSDGIMRVLDSDSKTIRSETPVTKNAGSAENTENILMAISANTHNTAVISAKGQLIVLDEHMNITMDAVAHDPVMESWTCALAPESGLVASGADDCCLKLWDIRTAENVMTNRRTHLTGVTTLKFMSDTELLSGSYDERIRRFDIRNLNQPITEVRSIGGVWRLKPLNDLLYVAACYGGCQIVRLDDFTPISAPYTQHKSMAYGISPINSSTAISCSFYDRIIHMWQF